MIDPATELDGRYRIIRLLGEGAMGAVYEAEHAAIQRKVAIKVLHAHFAKIPGAVQRFAREARTTATIGHENIVDVFDTGMHEGQPFLVMELLRGETLGERLARRSTLPMREAAGIIGRVLSALAAAHAKGVIHRDLKPDNVFLAEHMGKSVVKLLDFGVSKLRRPDTLYQSTQDGIPVGTPAYMAPEQWMGRRDIDHRADLFAVGVMLYEMLTGGMPYEGASQGELFLEIVRGTETPPRPSAIAPEVPDGIDDVVLRALERERAARFATAQDFLDALRPFGAEGIVAIVDAPAPVVDDGVLVRRATRADPTLMGAPGWAGRHGSRAFVALVLVALASAVLASGAGAKSSRRAAPARATIAPPGAPGRDDLSDAGPMNRRENSGVRPDSAEHLPAEATGRARRPPRVGHSAHPREPSGVGALRISREF